METVTHFYNAFAAGKAEEKRFRKIKLSEGGEGEVASTLSLISRTDMEPPALENFYNEYVVDRQVKQTLQEMLQTPGKGLARLIQRKTPNLSEKAVALSLRRLVIHIDSPTPGLVQKGPGKAPHPPKSAAALVDIIKAGLLSPPVELFREFKGSMLKAILKSDGTLEFQGKPFRTCSGAAVAATGRSTDGWDFWQCMNSEGKKSTLKDLRKKLTLMKGKGA
jgi:hypothetical protein